MRSSENGYFRNPSRKRVAKNQPPILHHGTEGEGHVDEEGTTKIGRDEAAVGDIGAWAGNDGERTRLTGAIAHDEAPVRLRALFLKRRGRGINVPKREKCPPEAPGSDPRVSGTSTFPALTWIPRQGLGRMLDIVPLFHDHGSGIWMRQEARGDQESSCISAQSHLDAKTAPREAGELNGRIREKQRVFDVQGVREGEKKNLNRREKGAPVRQMARARPEQESERGRAVVWFLGISASEPNIFCSLARSAPPRRSGPNPFASNWSDTRLRNFSVQPQLVVLQFNAGVLEGESNPGLKSNLKDAAENAKNDEEKIRNLVYGSRDGPESSRLRVRSAVPRGDRVNFECVVARPRLEVKMPRERFLCLPAPMPGMARAPRDERAQAPRARPGLLMQERERETLRKGTVDKSLNELPARGCTSAFAEAPATSQSTPRSSASTTRPGAESWSAHKGDDGTGAHSALTSFPLPYTYRPIDLTVGSFGRARESKGEAAPFAHSVFFLPAPQTRRQLQWRELERRTFVTMESGTQGCEMHGPHRLSFSRSRSVSGWYCRNRPIPAPACPPASRTPDDLPGGAESIARKTALIVGGACDSGANSCGARLECASSPTAGVDVTGSLGGSVTAAGAAAIGTRVAIHSRSGVTSHFSTLSVADWQTGSTAAASLPELVETTCATEASIGGDLFGGEPVRIFECIVSDAGSCDSLGIMPALWRTLRGTAIPHSSKSHGRSCDCTMGDSDATRCEYGEARSRCARERGSPTHKFLSSCMAVSRWLRSMIQYEMIWC
ncbi:hypothetical protein C8R47DRAFT_1078183 [Mycena vitilis]|nr:hypothetical protein C8R47DRAFT_1078183 [Mycena vitilis]